MFDKNLFFSKLQDHTPQFILEYFEEINSTNSYLLDKEDFAEGYLALAEFQLAGKGRLDRKWVAEKGENLTFSFLIKPKLKNEHLSYINFCVALSLAQAIEKTCSKKVEIKWPNDLLINKKKFCGILIESKFQGSNLDRLIIGIGININQTDFPAEFSNRTTSIKKEFGMNFSREEILAQFFNQFYFHYDNLEIQIEQIFKEWKSKCKMFGSEIELTNGIDKFSGIFYDVDLDGSLILYSNLEYKKFNAGDITIIKK